MQLVISQHTDRTYVYKEACLYSDEKKLSFYFRFPQSTAKDLTHRADPFVISLIFVMMQLGGGVVKLLGHLYQIQFKKICLNSLKYGIFGTRTCIQKFPSPQKLFKVGKHLKIMIQFQHFLEDWTLPL